MKLYDLLQRASSEEDVKDIYIRKLFLTDAKRGTVDIESLEVWAEAKKGNDVSCYAMFTQLLHYVHIAQEKGIKKPPPLLAVFDQQKAALMKTSDAIAFLAETPIKWGKSPSQFTQETLDEVSKYIGTYFFEYNLETQSDEFVKMFRHARQHNEFIRIQIVPKNLKHVFNVWVEMIGREITDIDDEAKYRLLFFADIMSDGKIATHDDLPAELIYRNDQPAFFYDGKMYRLGNTDGYRKFWMIYHRPPADKYHDNLLERGDKLIPPKKRSFEGAFFTPSEVVDKAYETLGKTLGKNWQEEYIVWDMCCGAGNLEKPHSNHRNVFMSTLDKSDVDIMKSNKTCVGAAGRFQYDYLNNDITDDGEIDYSLTNRIPKDLQKAIKQGKKILVLMNPPYAESGEGFSAGNKAGVAKTKVATTFMKQYGKSSNELFVQFLVRISKEIPTATIAIFSKLKYVNAPNSEKFRAHWNAEYKAGFIVHSKAFDGLKGDFPIGFLIWQTHHGTNKNYTIDKISPEILDKQVQSKRHKDFYNLPNEKMLNTWIDRPKANKIEALPLKNTISPATAKFNNCYWSDGAIAHMLCDGNDLQNAFQTALFSSTHKIGHKGGFYVTPDNLWQAAIVFSVRRLIKQTWINDRDQFLIPTGKLTDEFKNDCLIWMLFNGGNLTAGADGLESNGKDWSLVNHFIPFSETQVNARDRFESDFMVQYLKGKKLSIQANAVMAEGRKLWQTFFAKTDTHNIRTEYKINRPDAGWYQIRNALKERNKKSDGGQTDFTAFEQSYQILSDKLHPMVFDLGFLK